MGSSVPLRTDFDATRLRGFARKCGDNRQIRRLLSLAAVYDGMNRTEAAKVGGMYRSSAAFTFNTNKAVFAGLMASLIRSKNQKARLRVGVYGILLEIWVQLKSSA